jgi:Tfp pilus assembly protein PilX
MGVRGSPTTMRLLRLIKRDEGVTLIVALGAMLVLGIAGTTVLYASSTNTRSANYSKAKGTAFALAEAGLHESLSVLSNQPTNDPADPTLLATRTSTYSTGTVTWGGTYDDATAKWTITSTGQVTNPTDPASSEALRTITAKVPIRPITTQTSQTEAWNYIFSYGTGSTCDMSLISSVNVETRLLVSGNLCVRDSSNITGSQTEVLVGGQTKIFGSAYIGTSGAKIGRIDSVNGCRYESTTPHNPCTTTDKVHAVTATSSPDLLAAPSPNWDYWYSKSAPGPIKTCTGANKTGTPPTFDNDTTRNRSAPAANLTPGASYGCKVYLGTELLGELSWNNSTKVLTVKGTIFIDGNLQATQAATYTGQATIYISGSFYMSSGRVCAVDGGSGCNFTTGSGGWDPNTKLLAIVTNGAGGFGGSVEGDTTVKLDSSVHWQGALYGGPYRARILSSVRFAGPVIADEVYVDSSLQTEPFSTIVTSPTGLPGNNAVYAAPDKLELFSG